MKTTLYTAYVSSFTYRKANTDNIETTNHEDNVLIGVGAKDEEDVKRVIEAWAKSKHREIWQIDDICPIPRKEFLSPISKPKPRWKWYEVHGTTDALHYFYNKRYERTIIFGYIYAPNKKAVKEQLRQMGVTSIMYIDQGEKYTYIHTLRHNEEIWTTDYSVEHFITCLYHLYLGVQYNYCPHN